MSGNMGWNQFLGGRWPALSVETVIVSIGIITSGSLHPEKFRKFKRDAKTKCAIFWGAGERFLKPRTLNVFQKFSSINICNLSL